MAWLPCRNNLVNRWPNVYNMLYILVNGGFSCGPVVEFMLTTPQALHLHYTCPTSLPTQNLLNLHKANMWKNFWLISTSLLLRSLCRLEGTIKDCNGFLIQEIFTLKYYMPPLEQIWLIIITNKITNFPHQELWTILNPLYLLNISVLTQHKSHFPYISNTIVIVKKIYK